MLDQFNDWMALAFAVTSGTAVMSRRVKDGIIIKIGLSFCSLGFFGTFLSSMDSSGPNAQAAAGAVTHIGILICVAGYLYRIFRHKHRNRRLSDWWE